MYGKTRSPLYDAFFNYDNLDTIQDMIQDGVKKATGTEVNKQNYDDLYNIMQSVYSTNSFNPRGQLDTQVRWMNTMTANKCIEQVSTGIRMYQMYIHDISNPIRTNNLPVYKSSYGNKIGAYTKIGWKN